MAITLDSIQELYQLKERMHDEEKEKNKQIKEAMLSLENIIDGKMSKYAIIKKGCFGKKQYIVVKIILDCRHKDLCTIQELGGMKLLKSFFGKYKKMGWKVRWSKKYRTGYYLFITFHRKLLEQQKNGHSLNSGTKSTALEKMHVKLQELEAQAYSLRLKIQNEEAIHQLGQVSPNSRDAPLLKAINNQNPT